MKLKRKESGAAIAAHFDKQGNILTVKPEGHLDTATAPELEKEMKQYLENVQDIIMDFADVEYISSAGLRVLLSAEKLLEKRGGSVKLIHVNQSILEIFDLVGFMDVITVVSD